MARVVRKNLMVDAEALRELARLRGTSESEAVRAAVEFALGTQGMVDAMKRLHEMGAFADFEELFPPLEDRAAEAPAEYRVRRKRATAGGS